MIRRVLEGDIDAYAGLVTRYQHEVWRIAAALLRDTAATEDLVQKAFVNAYFQLKTFDPDREFGPWVHTIARNLVREEARKRSRESRHLHAYHERLLARLGPADAASNAESELKTVLEDCRGRLSPEDSAILALRYDRAWGFEEIAASVGRTVPATRQLLARIRLKLRDCIQRSLEKA